MIDAREENSKGTSQSHTSSSVFLPNTQLTKRKPPFVVSISSGKGGVGKTLTTVNLAIATKRMGRKPLIFDGDLGLSNVDVVLGLQARYNISDVLNGHASMKEVIIDGPMGIKIIPSGSGISSLAQLSYVQRQYILDEIENLDIDVDILFIDTGAGIVPNVLHLSAVANQLVVVTTPEPHAMTDAYALIKVLADEYKTRRFMLLVNMVRSPEEGVKVAARISDVAKQFLDVDIEYAGHVPLDPQMQQLIMKRRAASEFSTFTISGQAWNDIARKVLTKAHPTDSNDDGFWEKFLVDQPECHNSLI